MGSRERPYQEAFDAKERNEIRHSLEEQLKAAGVTEDRCGIRGEADEGAKGVIWSTRPLSAAPQKEP